MKLDRIFSFLAPKEDKFFPLFKQASKNLIEASEQLIKLMDMPIGVELNELVNYIKELESKGDQIYLNLVNTLNSTFITPFDREDIFDLSAKTDLIVDFIFGAAKKIQLYIIDDIPSELKEMASYINKAAIEIDTAFNGLGDVQILFKYKNNCQRIEEIEKEADFINYNYLAKLFHEEKNAIELIKRKDVLSTLEEAVDCCDDLADILSSVIVKIA